MVIKHPCAVCKFSVHNNHKAIFCDICHFWTHLKCTPFTTKEYSDFSNSSEPWYCSSCLSNIFPFNHLEDDCDYYFALFDINPNPFFNPDLIKNKCFNPFIDDPDSRCLLMNPDICSGALFSATSNILSSCVYLTSDNFNNLLLPETNIFSALHVNIRCLNKNFDNLSSFLATLNRTFSVIGVSETWLDKNNDDSFKIPGFKFKSNRRKHKSGGGVGIFIKSNLNFKLRNDLQSAAPDIYESIFIEIIQPSSKNILVGCIYKAPDVTVSDFNKLLVFKIN